MVYRKGIYLLPNLLTTAALFCGFYSIIASLQGAFVIAAIAIYLAILFDGLDGRVARLTNTQTEFGVEFDSLSDMVSFGVAPALLAYVAGISQFGRLGWLIAFFYVAATALRLARFNSQVHKSDSRYFRGLPCPLAAGVIAGFVWLNSRYGFILAQAGWLLALLSSMGVLMLSSLLYYSFKQLRFRGSVSFISLCVGVLVLMLISFKPPECLFLGLCGYALSAPMIALWRLLRKGVRLGWLQRMQRKRLDS